MRNSEKKKILCLHGGSDSASNFRNQSGMQDLIQSKELVEFEFVFVDSPLSGGVWWEDPPNKDTPTTDPEHAKATIDFLTNYINDSTNGPFYGILGYSQGAAAIAVLLAYTEIVFEKVILCNGYLPTTHQGLMDTINSNKPLFTNPLIFLAENDIWFYDLGLELKTVFQDAQEIISTKADHALPRNTDETFGDVLRYIADDSSIVFVPEAEPEPWFTKNKLIIGGGAVVGIAVLIFLYRRGRKR
jgi:pimeloyl-ACP methyl ester carboxylesterase